VATWESDSLFAFARECQIAAGAFVESPEPSEILAAVHSTLYAVPDPIFPAAVPIIATALAVLGRHVLAQIHYRPHAPHSRLQQVLGLLLMSYTNDGVTLQDLSGRLNTTRGHVSTLINSRTGRSFLEHLHALRVVHAVLLLTDSEMSVQEIAVRCGYRQTSHLDRHFAARLRLAPGRFRRLQARRDITVVNGRHRCRKEYRMEMKRAEPPFVVFPDGIPDKKPAISLIHMDH